MTDRVEANGQPVESRRQSSRTTSTSRDRGQECRSVRPPSHISSRRWSFRWLASLQHGSSLSFWVQTVLGGILLSSRWASFGW
ncbi:hypothetical protein C9J85_02230 [Haloferax sp. wsp5]|nr:hypothetical protein C9J85_02230 [Haloferax sp. wsp5]